MFTIPGHRAPQTLFEADLRLVAKSFTGGGDVGEGVLDIPGTRRAVNRGLFEVEQFGQEAVGLVDRVSLPTGNVEDPPGDLFRWGFKGQQVRGDGVFDVGEIARLLAVAAAAIRSEKRAP